MSKIGKIDIVIPDKVKVALAGNILNIEGPLGKKSLDIDLDTFNLLHNSNNTVPCNQVVCNDAIRNYTNQSSNYFMECCQPNPCEDYWSNCPDNINYSGTPGENNVGNCCG